MPVRDDNDPEILLITLIRPPDRTEEIVLSTRDGPVPRSRWNMLHNQDTGEWHILMRDAVWSDCRTAAISFVPRGRFTRRRRVGKW